MSVTIPTCMACVQRPTFVTIRCESTVGVAATYSSCADLDCLAKLTERIAVDLANLALRAGIAYRSDRPHPDAIDTTTAEPER